MTTGQALKRTGMKQAAENRAELLERARQIALQFAHKNGTVTADDVAFRMDKPLGPAAGSIFKTKDFEFTGERRQSTRPDNHARELKVWRLTIVGKQNAEKASEPIPTSPDLAPRVRKSPPMVKLPEWLR